MSADHKDIENHHNQPSPEPYEITPVRRIAIRNCITICLLNGWAPPADNVWGLVRLREAYRRRERQEDAFQDQDVARLRFARWLYLHGKLFV